MSETIIAVIIASIASPLLLETYRAILGRKSKTEEETRTRITQLETRVIDLQAANTKQLVEIGVLQARNQMQEQEITKLREEGNAKDIRIHDLETQVDALNLKRGSKRL